VVKVTDGDTITVLTEDHQQVKVRLYGIDAPEKKQPFGSKCTDYLRELVGMKNVEIEEIDKDRYGRTVGLVTLPDGQVVNEKMVGAGLAWVYRQYCRKFFCSDWLKLEDDTKIAKKGLWLDKNPIAPWEWRK